MKASPPAARPSSAQTRSQERAGARARARAQRRRQQTPEEEALQLTVNHWAKRMRVEPPRVFIEPSQTVPHLRRDHLHLDRPLVEGPAETLEVVVCHELAHLPQRPERRALKDRAAAILLLTVLLCATAVAVAIALGDSSATSLSTPLLGAPLAHWLLLPTVTGACLLMLWKISHITEALRAQEYRCDEQALRACLCEMTETIEPHGLTHEPAEAQRHWEAFCRLMFHYAPRHPAQPDMYCSHPSPHERVRHVAAQLQLPLPEWAKSPSSKPSPRPPLRRS